MYYDASKTNMDPTAVFGSEDSPCIDHKPDNTNCINYKLGQCLDDVPTVAVPSPLPRVFMTWFEIPTYISEATAQDYINTLLDFCKASQRHAPTKFAGIT